MATAPRDPGHPEYLGNIFGWRLSLIGLGLILALCALVAYRYFVHDVPIEFYDPLEAEEEKARFAPPSKAERDSLELDLNQ